MQFQQHGITVSVDDEELRRIVLERLSGAHELIHGEAITFGPCPPAIGAEWPTQGGIYAGIARGQDGGRDYHLIVGPEHESQLDWKAAVEWAAKAQHGGSRDFALPTRKEQALCFANVPELFKAECYWSGEQHASDSDYAWGQNFYDGSQYYWYKYYELRARLVRRLIIQ